MNLLTILRIALIGGAVSGTISSLILAVVFYEDIQNIVRYLDSIRGEVSVALDALSGDGESK